MIFSIKGRVDDISARFGIKLLMECIESRKERSLFNVFRASRAKIAEVLLSTGEKPDCEMLYPQHQSVI